MYIRLSELKINPSKYFDLARTTDIVVTRHGRRLGRIVCEEQAAQAERQLAIEAFFDRDQPKSQPDTTEYDPVKEARLRERGLLE